MADTLEKFENGILDKSSPDAKHFVVFKRRLYDMYQVSHRSREEHELYSFQIERKNLAASYRANLVHVENQVANSQRQQAQHLSQLGGRVYNARLLNPTRLFGLGYAAAGLYTWNKFAVLAHSFNPTLVTIALGVFTLKFIRAFSQTQYIQSVELAEDGKAKLTVQESILKSYSVTADIKDIHQLGVYQENGAQTAYENRILLVNNYTDEAGKTHAEPLIVSLSADSVSNKEVLNFLISEQETKSITDGDFAALLLERS